MEKPPKKCYKTVVEHWPLAGWITGLMMLDIVDAKPLLHLGLRLGEGTGALCAYPLVDSAVRMMNEMNNFDNAKITKYF